jgi:hypothetical protein
MPRFEHLPCRLESLVDLRGYMNREIRGLCACLPVPRTEFPVQR